MAEGAEECLVVFCSLRPVECHHVGCDAARGGAASFTDIFVFFPFFFPSVVWDCPWQGNVLNGPLWFMRDLIFLFLLSPILGKYARYNFPALLLFSVQPECSKYFSHDDAIGICMSPYSTAFFAAGCFLSSFGKSQRDAFLAWYSLPLLMVYLVGNAIMSKLFHWNLHWPFLGSLLAVWMLYQLARCIEVYVPWAKPFALKFAPVTFLTFAFHSIVYPLIPLTDAYTPLLLPFIVFAAMSLLFFAMKRWCRPLLHLVAHYKLRPDDIKPGHMQG